MTADFDIARFDPSDEAHAAFVYGTFAQSTLSHWPWNEIGRDVLMAKLKRHLAVSRVGVAVPRGMPAEFIGWAAVESQRRIVYAFTKYAFRRLGVATTLATELGAKIGELPVGVLFWTPAAARVVSRKPAYGLFHDLLDAFDED
jgi:hypothetical protein